MKVYLAITSPDGIEGELDNSDILIAFPYIKNFKNQDIKKFRNFILDSGVFTMINSGKRFNIKEYIDEYANFVRENEIRQYVEMDVDQIYGVEKTREFRNYLEEKVGWRSIPVWHTIRGIDSFIEDCKNYNYIALGYFITEGLPDKTTVKYAKSFVDVAHSYNCRIHGLGFTKTKILKNIGFDSVDSSSWTHCQRFGQVHYFDRINGIVKRIGRPPNKRIVDMGYKLLRLHSFTEWKKYQNFAYNNILPIWK